MDKTYEPLQGGRPHLDKQRSYASREGDRINTTARYAVYLSLMLCIFVACVAFWGASRSTPLLFSLDASRSVENHPKSMTFTWVLIGTILAYTTGSLFNQLLKVSVQQNVAAYGLKIGLLEFWSRVYSRKWLHDQRSGRTSLSVLSLVFAIAFGLLVSAYTGLITPTRVYIENGISGSELGMTTEAFNNWFNYTGFNVAQNCSATKLYGTGVKAITLPLCGQVKDPLSYVSAGIAAIEAKYAQYDPKTTVLGLSFNGTTKGVLPRGWNTIRYFDKFANNALPPVANYNYSMIQQGISANVSCKPVGVNSAIVWDQQGISIYEVTNGASLETVYNQSFHWGPFKSLDIPEQTNLFLSGKNMVATFGDSYGKNREQMRMDLAAYGSYASDWKVPNMTCVIKPYVVTVNVTYNNATGMFGTEIVSVPSKNLSFPQWIATVGNWLFRVTTVQTGNQIMNSIIALQNTPSYAPGVFSNVTINWPKAIELFLQGTTEYQATRMRMLFEAEINSTHVQPSGFEPINGIVTSWRLGYNGATGAIVILFPLMGFVLICSLVVIFLGARTGIKHVSKFDPTNTTHIIIASALGGRNGRLTTLNGEDAIHADAKALDLKIEYRDDMQGFQEVPGDSATGYAELNDLRSGGSGGGGDAVAPAGTESAERLAKPGVFARQPFQRLRTG